MTRISGLIERFHLLKHPFYQKWMAGELSLSTLQRYALQYYPHVTAFPRFVSAVHSHCENPTARRHLLENLLDEEGYPESTPHPQLWKNFGCGLGLKEQDFEVADIAPQAQNMVDCFEKLTKSSYAKGLGALYAYESQIPEIATAKIKGLKERYNIEDPETLAFFKIHETADQYHSEACAQLLDLLSDKEKQEAYASAEEACLSLWNFLSEVDA
jgi:pyrroloquinoline-quinone synthase